MIIAVPLGLLVYTMYREGAFDTTKNSILILMAGVNRFRRLGQEDMFEVEEMNMRNEKASGELDRQRMEAEQEKQRRLEQKKREKKRFLKKK